MLRCSPITRIWQDREMKARFPNQPVLGGEEIKPDKGNRA